MKKNILLAIRIVSALVFIVSGLSKLFPAEVFELTLINAGAATWNTSPYLARFIIAVELFLGVALLQKHYLKRLIVTSSLLLLIIFSVHLIYIIIAIGNSGNCGCFGELLPMSPLNALVKNIVLIFLLVYFYLSYKEETIQKLFIPSGIFILSVAAVFIISPIQKIQKDMPIVNNIPLPVDDIPKDSIVQQVVKKDTTTKEVIVKEEEKQKDKVKLLPKSESVFSDFHYFSDSVYVDLDSGIKLVGVLSLDCEHCMTAATDLIKLQEEMKLPPVYFLYLGEEDQLQNFYAHSGANDIYFKILNARTFFSLIKDSPPRVVLLNNGNIIGDWDISTFSKGALKKALTK